MDGSPFGLGLPISLAGMEDMMMFNVSSFCPKAFVLRSFSEVQELPWYFHRAWPVQIQFVVFWMFATIASRDLQSLTSSSVHLCSSECLPWGVKKSSLRCKFRRKIPKWRLNCVTKNINIISANLICPFLYVLLLKVGIIVVKDETCVVRLSPVYSTVFPPESHWRQQGDKTLGC